MTRKRKLRTVIIHNLRSTRIARKLSLIGLAALLLLPTLCSQDALLTAQNSKGKPYALIVGTVWGPDDRPVYGVKVKIRRTTDKPNKVRWEVYSDHQGELGQCLPAGEA